MTPQEKAKELVHKMFNVDLQCDNEAMCMLYPHALKCALIAVEEILDITKRPTYNQDNWNEITGFRYDKFWYEVKHEIEKL